MCQQIQPANPDIILIKFDWQYTFWQIYLSLASNSRAKNGGRYDWLD